MFSPPQHFVTDYVRDEYKRKQATSWTCEGILWRKNCQVRLLCLLARHLTVCLCFWVARQVATGVNSKTEKVLRCLLVEIIK